MDVFKKAFAILLIVGLLFAAHPARVQAAQEYNQRIEFQDDFDSCSGERVSISGVQHIVGRQTTDKSGRIHFGFTRNLKGTGVGSVSGDRYILVDSVAYSSVELNGQPQTYMQEYHSRFVRLGEAQPADDTLIHFLTRITFDASGNMTTSIEILDLTCK